MEGCDCDEEGEECEEYSFWLSWESDSCIINMIVILVSLEICVDLCRYGDK